jgi:hypothetical protein
MCKCIILPFPHRAAICRPIRAQIEQLAFAESIIGTVLQTVPLGCPDERPSPLWVGENGTALHKKQGIVAL